MGDSETLFEKRRWLNRLGHHSIAFVYGEIWREEWDGETVDGVVHHNVHTNGEVRIGDCSRTVILQFEDNANSRYKVRKLIEFLEDFEEHLLGAIEE